MHCPGIIPDPLILDQTFPRTLDELAIARGAASQLFDIVLTENKACLILTKSFLEIVEETDWANGTADRVEIHRFLSQLVLRQGQFVKVFNPDPVEGVLHPLPGTAPGGPLVEYWQRDVASLHQIHMEHLGPNYAIGIICSSALAGEPKGCYEQTVDGDVFPLVGEAGLQELESLYEYDCHADVLQQPVSYQNAKDNVSVLGATVRRPRGSSHWMANFVCGRSWPIDRNVDPQPDRFLKQLIPITGFPLDYIHYVLVTGQKPNLRFRLDFLTENS